ncbi:hypothetical protein CERSUDRAFT_85781 [Gelatoporia subvermispora B]|uniref:Abscisic acid G-protein coupled receptor-like domain-containing protein n=1 Tax=Ceriporiopsis subvermispora (strain B) TaxID=914234 RepID=M2QSN2_CERS8|nr:hypothetical protein CERSUDRAFT_85781 [Gelatoporia subvermispora B]
MSTTVVLETWILFLLRAALFLACRNYLLQNLYHDLQGLSTERSTTPPASDNAEDATELDSLPQPSTANAPATPVPSIMKGKRSFHSVLSRSLFALCFEESCTMFGLLMCQALGLLHGRTRLLNWNISLSVLLTSILVLIPLSYSLVLSDTASSSIGAQARQRPSFGRILLNTIPVCLFLFFLEYIPLPEGLHSSSFIATTLSRLTVLGTIILGGLSGFGAMTAIWTFLPLFGLNKGLPSDEDISIAEQGLERVRQDLARQRYEVQKLQSSQPGSNAGWLSNVVTSVRGDSRLTSATQELRGLEALESQMSQNVEVLKQRQAEAKYAKTMSGKLLNWGGRLFAIYCVYRIIITAIDLVVPLRPRAAPGEANPTGADMISTWLAYSLSLVSSGDIDPEKLAAVSRQISLGLVGVIILSSIRLVLRGVARALKVTSRNLGASLMLLILAQLMGIYLLSTLIQLRTSFPSPPSQPGSEAEDINLFSTLPEYELFGSLFDGSFLLTAGASAVVRWFGDRIGGVSGTI